MVKRLLLDVAGCVFQDLYDLEPALEKLRQLAGDNFKLYYDDVLKWYHDLLMSGEYMWGQRCLALKHALLIEIVEAVMDRLSKEIPEEEFVLVSSQITISQIDPTEMKTGIPEIDDAAPEDVLEAYERLKRRL